MSEELKKKISEFSDGKIRRMVRLNTKHLGDKGLIYAEEEFIRRGLSIDQNKYFQIPEDETDTDLSPQGLGLILSVIYLLFLILLFGINLTPTDLGEVLGGVAAQTILGGGFLVLVSAMYGLISEPTGDGRPVLAQLLLGFGVLLFIFFLVRYRIFRRRRQTIKAQELLSQRSNETPVLYLRSFEADYDASININTVTEEEYLAQALNYLGPVIAIGRPGERLPQLGASRMYVSDEDWQRTVVDLMKKSRVVALRIGDTNGFWWEFQKAVDLVPLPQLLLLVPENEELYKSFCEKAQPYLPISLPSYKREKDYIGNFVDFIRGILKRLPPPEIFLGYFLSFGHMPTLKGFIYFSPDSSPKFVKFRLNWIRGDHLSPSIPVLIKAFQPFYRQLNFTSIKVPRIRLLKLIGIFIGLLYTILYTFLFLGGLMSNGT